MEKQEIEKSYPASDDATQLTRARSFKSKQLVRSQALREAPSPPRAASPEADNVVVNADCDRTVADSDVSSLSHSEVEEKKLQVEIQITSGNWDDAQADQRQRNTRWLGNKSGDWSRDLLSNSPRVTCVCGTCACPQCRGRRRKHQCPTKQDSGIVCSDDCPDCTDSDHTGSGTCELNRKWHSADAEYCSCRRTDKTLPPDSADDKSDLSGPDLVQFIKDTLNKNARDRVTLLKIEKELHALVSDTGRCIVRFPVMTSYGRMLVHRCAALFQLAHRLDASNKTCVLVSKTGTSGGRLPCTGFKEWCTSSFPDLHRDNTNPSNNTKSILKRATQSLEEGSNSSFAQNRSKSLEQRERDYERVRSRIFSEENCQDESQWPWLNSGPVKLLTPDTGRKPLVKVQSLESSTPVVQWRSRGAVSKSHSFGGYAAGDPPAVQPRLLSRQGDLASSSWRLSPSSSGYKTLSLRSTDSVTPSPTGGASPEPALVWAVTDLARVPPGALVIHPQSGRPLTNPDGSLYHFDPAHPPVLYEDGVGLPSEDEKVDANNDRRRGRLEKQHSFIDNDCECQASPTEDCRTKCCCECQKPVNVNATQQRTVDKPSPPQPQPEPKPNIQPPSPCKTRPEIPQTTPNQPSTDQYRPNYEPNKQSTVYTEQTYNPEQTNQRYNEVQTQNRKTYSPEQTTNQRQYNEVRKQYVPNHRPPSYESTNQKQVYDQSANQRPSSDGAVNHRVSANKLIGPESVEVQHYVPQQGYIQYRTDEVSSPPQAQVYMQPDMSQLLLQQKMQHNVIHDAGLRPMTLTNVVYPAALPQGYPYVNQYRAEPAMQPAMYHQIQQQVEEPKPVTSSPQADTGFRIDPSYPYPAVDYSQCGTCTTAYVDPNAIQHQHRPSYNVAYGQMELPQAAMLPQTYQHQMLLPQPHYTYGEAMQWPNIQPVMGVSPKVMLHDLYPYCGVVCPPQLVPPTYGVCVAADNPATRRGSPGNRYVKRGSIAGSHRDTPHDNRFRPDDRKPYSPRLPEHQLSRQNSGEIQAKIQQIKEQMAQLSARDRDNKPYRKPEEGKRRDNNNGILGSYPVNNMCNGRVGGRPINDESQLSTAARAIVNSIRSSMQSRNHYPVEYRPHYKQDTRRPPAPHNQFASDRQMSPQTWCRRSPAAAHPNMLNNPRRPHPHPRNERR